MSPIGRAAVAAALLLTLSGCGTAPTGPSVGGPLSHVTRTDGGSSAVTYDRDRGAGREIVSSQIYAIACTTGETATITGVEADTDGDVREVRVRLGEIDRSRGDDLGSFLGELPELDEPYSPRPFEAEGRTWRDAVGETVEAPCRAEDLRGGVPTSAAMFASVATIGPDGGRVRAIRIAYSAGGRDWVTELSDAQVIRRGPACQGACARP